MRRTLPLAALLLALMGGPAAAQQFSADLVSSVENAPPARIWVADGKMRMEAGNGRGIYLPDRARRRTLLMLPERKVYLEQPMGQAVSDAVLPQNADDPCPHWQEMNRSLHQDAGEWSCTRVGRETVNGRSTVKYEGKSAKGEHAYVWIDPKLKAMVKSEDAKGRGMELKNIKEGAQPAALFEIPAGYQKLDLQQMMQQRGGKP